MAFITYDLAAAHILDFIARTELGPKNADNYNAYFAHGDSTLKIKTWPIKDVLTWSTHRGTPASSATGRYQFMHYTLSPLLAEVGLKPTDTFSPENQDKLGIQLLIRRGYGLWWSGKWSHTQFAAELSKEWASFPWPIRGGGKSYGASFYAKDGLNKSLTTVPMVLAMLAEAYKKVRPMVAANGDPNIGLVHPGHYEHHTATQSLVA